MTQKDDAKTTKSMADNLKRAARSQLKNDVYSLTTKAKKLGLIANSEATKMHGASTADSRTTNESLIEMKNMLEKTFASQVQIGRGGIGKAKKARNAKRRKIAKNKKPKIIQFTCKAYRDTNSVNAPSLITHKGKNYIQASREYIITFETDFILFEPTLVPITEQLFDDVLDQLTNNDEWVDWFLRNSSFVTAYYFYNIMVIPDEATAVKNSGIAWDQIPVMADGQVINNRFIYYNVNIDGTGSIFDSLAQDGVEYSQINYRSNCCVLNMIIKTWAAQFNDKLGIELNYQYLYKLLFGDKPFCEYGPIAVTFHELSTKFLRLFNLGIHVSDIHNVVNYEYPKNFTKDDLNRNITPRSINLLYHNQHIFTLTDGKGYSNSVLKNKDKKQLVKVSKKFRLFKPRQAEKNIFFIDSTSSIIDIMRKNQGIKHYDFIYNGDMFEILKECVEKKITPKLTSNRGNVSTISMDNLLMNKKKISYTIRYPFYEVDEGPLTSITNIAYYEQFNMLNDLMRSLIFNSNNLSYYSKSVSDFFKDCRVPAHYGTTADHNLDKEQIAYLDMVKCYYSQLMKIDKIPVFNKFEVFHPYDGAPIEDSTYYTVEILELRHPYVERFCGVTGREIRLTGIKCKILEFATASYFTDSLISVFDQKLNSSTLIKDHKKSICNINIGLCAKVANKKTKTTLYTSLIDAVNAKIQYGGQVFSYDGFYLHEVNIKEPLIDGFKPLHFLVLTMARTELYLQREKLLADGFNVIGEKVDCLFFEIPTDLENAVDKDAYFIERGYDIRNELNGWSYDSKSTLSCNFIDFVENQFIPHYSESIPINQLTVRNEFDTNEVSSQMGNNRSIILAKYPGSGKTYNNVHNGLIRKFKVLCACPTNSLAHDIKAEYKVEAITVHHLLGLAFDSAEGKKKFKLADYNYISYEELYFHPVSMLTKIDNFITANSEGITHVGNGDSRQNAPIGENVTGGKYQKIIDAMFPNQLTLFCCKRLILEEDRATLKLIEHDLFNTDISNLDLVNKYFSKNIVYNADEIKCNQHITYYRASSKVANIMTHKRVNVNKRHKTCVIDGLSYYEGLVIRMIKTLKIVTKKTESKTKTNKIESKTETKKIEPKMFNNYTYKITKISKDHITVSDVLTDEKFELTYNQVIKYTSLNYSKTVHSSQGLSIKEPYCIWDVNASKYITKNWLWVAITRAIRLSDIQFHFGRVANNTRTFQQMVEGYISQDVNKDRTLDQLLQCPQYIDAEWINDRYLKSDVCKMCSNSMTLEKGSENLLTVDRLNNLLPHVKTNCQLLCLACNRGKN